MQHRILTDTIEKTFWAKLRRIVPLLKVKFGMKLDDSRAFSLLPQGELEFHPYSESVQ